MELHNGSLLQGGKYTITRKLGQGSFGITYLAKARFTTHSSLGAMQVEANVAIKEFFMSEVNTRNVDGSSVEGSKGTVFTNYRRKFRKEAENLAKLQHSNIVKIFEVFDENGTTYYAMEFLDGLNLDDYIGRRGKIPENEAIGILGDIGAALSYMHSRRMLHLDIKPKNIMRRNDGDNCLIDFGLSKQFTADGEPESSTTIGLGTPGYAPLEQAHQQTDDGSHRFPATLDVYALGATLYKMLSGCRPPEATFVLNDGFPSRPLEQAGVSARTIKAIRKAMAPIKKDRWTSIDEFLSALGAKQAIKDEPYTPVAPTALTIANTWKQRNWFVNIMGVIALLGFFIIWGYLSKIAYREATAGSGEPILMLLYYTAIPLTGIYSVVKLLYGEANGWRISMSLFAVYTLINLIVRWLPDDEWVFASSTLFVLYFSTLFIRKNGSSAFSLLRPIRFSFSNFRRWPLATRIISLGCLAIFIIAAIVDYTNLHIYYYSHATAVFITLIVLSLMLLRGRKAPLFIMIAVALWSYYRCFYRGWDAVYNLYSEYGTLLLLAILTLSLTLIRKNGRTAWQVMR